MISKQFLVISLLAAFVVLPAIASASDREDDVKRIDKSAQVFKEIMNTPDKGIPNDLLQTAKCIAIIPGEVKFAFILGGNYGRGIATCHTGHGWSAPMFVALGGGSVGYQIGGSSTDIIMLFMNDHALQSLLSDKFRLGADATVAAGPVGRHAAAATDLKLRGGGPHLFSLARRICWSQSQWRRRADGQEWRSRHVWRHVTHRQILDGKVAVPPSAEALIHQIHASVMEAKAQ